MISLLMKAMSKKSFESDFLRAVKPFPSCNLVKETGKECFKAQRFSSSANKTPYKETKTKITRDSWSLKAAPSSV